MVNKNNLVDIKVVIFDLVGTLIKRNEEQFISLINTIVHSSGISIKHSCTMSLYRDMYLKYSIGEFKDDQEYYSNIVSSMIGESVIINPCLQNKLTTAYFKCIQPYPDSRQVINCLTKKYSIILLSNFIKEWAVQILADYGMKSFFDEIIISSDIKVRKPSIEAYVTVMNKFPMLSAKNFVMIGDNYYIDLLTPIKLGMNGVLVDRDNISDNVGVSAINNLNQVLKLFA